MQIDHLQDRFDHVFSNVSNTLIVDVVVEIIQVRILIYSVDKVDWVFAFEDKAELVDVCIDVFLFFWNEK
jgi:hypothetical protein